MSVDIVALELALMGRQRMNGYLALIMLGRMV